jgi:hypothetical protein
MIHLGLSFVYTTISLYYLFTPVLTFEQRLHATSVSFLMLYSIVRSFRKIDDLVVLFLMHWSLYVIDGGRGIPFWMILHGLSLVVSDLLCTAEQKIYIMTSELHRLHPNWQFDFVYTHESVPRLSMTDTNQRDENDLLHSFVDTRSKHEYPAQMSPNDRLLWKFSDNKSIFINRERRQMITFSLFVLTFCFYGIWWYRIVESVRYYFFIDLILMIVLMTGWQVRMVIYHGVFAVATFYLHFKIFNSSLQSNNIVIH